MDLSRCSSAVRDGHDQAYHHANDPWRMAGAPRCPRTMPKATKAGRQMARFDEGELWCADDAVPPVSPAGWYFQPGGGSPLVWIGPFPTAEAAKVAPCGSDPFTAARRQLDAWVRAREEARSESPAEAEVAVDGSIDARRIPLRL